MMNRDPEHERLLPDVTLEGANFREAMLGQTLRVARRRRHWRQARRAAALFVVLGVAGFLVYRQGERRSPLPVIQSVSHVYRLVQTEPLPAAEVVSTWPFAGAMTAVAPVRIVQTAPTTGKFRLLNDDELLALVARPAVLIRIDAHSQRLIFANPEDEKGLQAQ
jgi:hypothetical protein